MLPRPVKILDSDSRCVINPEVGRFGLEAQNINNELNGLPNLANYFC